MIIPARYVQLGRRIIAAGIVFSAVAIQFPGLAYETGPALVVVKGHNIAPYTTVVDSFKDTIQPGEGGAKVIELSLEEEDRAAELKAAIHSVKPAAVLTLGTAVTRAVRGIFSDAPVVYTMILNPLQSGIAAPGVSMDIPYETKLRECKNILPGIRAVGTVYSPGCAQAYQEFKSACEKLGLRAVGREISSQNEFPAALDGIFNEADCFLMIADPAIYLPKIAEQLLMQGLKRRIPVVGLSAAYVKAGALMAFDCDYADLGKQSAELVSRIIGKDEAAVQASVPPRKANISFNLLVADRLGIKLPPEAVKQASEVFGK